MYIGIISCGSGDGCDPEKEKKLDSRIFVFHVSKFAEDAAQLGCFRG